MGIVLNEGLSQISLIFIYAAMAVYTAAFLTFASHLSRLASDKKKVRTSATMGCTSVGESS